MDGLWPVFVLAMVANLTRLLMTAVSATCPILTDTTYNPSCEGLGNQQGDLCQCYSTWRRQANRSHRITPVEGVVPRCFRVDKKCKAPIGKVRQLSAKVIETCSGGLVDAEVQISWKVEGKMENLGGFHVILFGRTNFHTCDVFWLPPTLHTITFRNLSSVVGCNETRYIVWVDTLPFQRHGNVEPNRARLSLVSRDPRTIKLKNIWNKRKEKRTCSTGQPPAVSGTVTTSFQWSATANSVTPLLPEKSSATKTEHSLIFGRMGKTKSLTARPASSGRTSTTTWFSSTPTKRTVSTVGSEAYHILLMTLGNSTSSLSFLYSSPPARGITTQPDQTDHSDIHSHSSDFKNATSTYLFPLLLALLFLFIFTTLIFVLQSRQRAVHAQKTVAVTAGCSLYLTTDCCLHRTIPEEDFPNTEYLCSPTELDDLGRPPEIEPSPNIIDLNMSSSSLENEIEPLQSAGPAIGNTKETILPLSPPQAFVKAYISYSRHCTYHTEQVVAFASWLRDSGIDAMCDVFCQTDISCNAPAFIETSINDAQFVLAICSPIYVQCWQNFHCQAEAELFSRDDCSANLELTKYEIFLVRNILFQNKTAPVVIPVELASSSRSGPGGTTGSQNLSLPVALQGCYVYKIGHVDNTNDQCALLYRLYSKSMYESTNQR